MIIRSVKPQVVLGLPSYNCSQARLNLLHLGGVGLSGISTTAKANSVSAKNITQVEACGLPRAVDRGEATLGEDQILSCGVGRFLNLHNEQIALYL